MLARDSLRCSAAGGSGEQVRTKISKQSGGDQNLFMLRKIWAEPTYHFHAHSRCGLHKTHLNLGRPSSRASASLAAVLIRPAADSELSGAQSRMLLGPNVPHKVCMIAARVVRGALLTRSDLRILRSTTRRVPRRPPPLQVRLGVSMRVRVSVIGSGGT